MSKIKTTVLSVEEFLDDESQYPTNFYIKTALGYTFIHTRDRQKAQDFVDEDYGRGKYKVASVKAYKTKSKLESGGLSCVGVATRKK